MIITSSISKLYSQKYVLATVPDCMHVFLNQWARIQTSEFIERNCLEELILCTSICSGVSYYYLPHHECHRFLWKFVEWASPKYICWLRFVSNFMNLNPTNDISCLSIHQELQLGPLLFYYVLMSCIFSSFSSSHRSVPQVVNQTRCEKRTYLPVQIQPW